jgi:AraC-like DNA-binding protein
LLASSRAGVDFIYQYGRSSDPRVVTQEVLAPAAETCHIILLPRLRDLCTWFDGREVRLSAGDRQLVIMPKAIPSRWVTGAGFAEAVHLHTSDDFIRAVAAEGGGGALKCGLIDVSGRGAAIYDAVVNEARLGCSTALRAEAFARLILSDLLDVAKPAAAGLTPLQIRRVREFVASRLDDPPTLAEMAKVVDRSVSHFARAFKVSLGMSPVAYVERMQIDEAKRHLSAGAPLIDVALSAGFASRSAFGAAFKRATGFTPGAWRRAAGRTTTPS